MRDVVAEQLRYGLRPLPIRGTLFGTTLLYLAGEEENSLTEIIDGLPGVRLDSDDINNGSRATWDEAWIYNTRHYHPLFLLLNKPGYQKRNNDDFNKEADHACYRKLQLETVSLPSDDYPRDWSFGSKRHSYSNWYPEWVDDIEGWTKAFSYRQWRRGRRQKWHARRPRIHFNRIHLCFSVNTLACCSDSNPRVLVFKTAENSVDLRPTVGVSCHTAA